MPVTDVRLKIVQCDGGFNIHTDDPMTGGFIVTQRFVKPHVMRDQEAYWKAPFISTQAEADQMLKLWSEYIRVVVKERKSRQ